MNNESVILTDAGSLVITHTLSLGDIVVSVLLVAILFVMIYENIIRRF